MAGDDEHTYDSVRCTVCGTEEFVGRSTSHEVSLRAKERGWTEELWSGLRCPRCSADPGGSPAYPANQ